MKENLISVYKWLKGQPIAAKILATIVLVCVSVMLLFFTSCGIAKSAISGDRVVDKEIRDSTHYEVILEK